MKSLFIALTIIFGLQSCDGESFSCEVPVQARGFGFSPLGFPVTYDFTSQFYFDVEDFRDSAVMWNGSWRDDAIEGSDAGEVPVGAETIQEATEQYCFVSTPVFGWRNGDTNLIQIPSNTINDWTNLDARTEFISMLKHFVIEHHPPYVFLGNENDFYYDTNITDYANWLIVYNLAYDAIKIHSPETLVGPVFNYEHLSGQGILNGWNQQFWPALENHDFSKVDVVGLSLYPFFQYADPIEVPASYLDTFFQKIHDKPVVITETGWPADNLGKLNPIWVTSEEAQVTYLNQLEKIIDGRDIPVMNWLFLNEMIDDGSHSETWKIFGSVSIRDDLGFDRQIASYWPHLVGP